MDEIIHTSRCKWFILLVLSYNVRTRGIQMATMAPELKSRRINFRLSETEEELLRKGAQYTGKKLTQFIVESACVVAESELAEQREFRLPPEQWRAFLAVLDKPVATTPALRRLLNEPSVIEIASRR